MVELGNLMGNRRLKSSLPRSLQIEWTLTETVKSERRLMREILEHLRYKQAHFGVHPYFQRLERNEPLGSVLPFASFLTVWAMTFQDLLRMKDARVLDPKFRSMSRHHRAEDAGHDKWFLADLVKIEGGHPAVRDVFSAAHAPTRDATYALMAEV